MQVTEQGALCRPRRTLIHLLCMVLYGAGSSWSSFMVANLRSGKPSSVEMPTEQKRSRMCVSTTMMLPSKPSVRWQLST